MNDVEVFLNSTDFWSHFLVYEATDFVKSVKKHFTDSDFTEQISKKTTLDALVSKVDKETSNLKKMQNARQ